MITIDEIRLDQGMTWYEATPAKAENTALFVAVTYGKCLYWIDGEKVLLEKGDYLLIPAGHSYYGKSIPTVFHEKIVASFLPLNHSAHSLPLLGPHGWEKFRSGSFEWSVDRLRTMAKEWQERVPYADVRASAILLETLTLWNRERDLGRQRDESKRHVERMKQYIQDHYREKITKDVLGAIIGRSPNHAAALFSRSTGLTISSYVHAVRMRTAAYMLRESVLTISEIAAYLGYSDVSYFHRIYKRSFGRSPSQDAISSS